MLRHGDADFSLPDSARQLSAKGKSQVVKMAQTYSRNMQDIELVITSPLRRALETTNARRNGLVITNSISCILRL